VVCAATALLLLAYLVIVRPWPLAWGATGAEARMRLPGDGIVAPARSQETRGITIYAGADRIWPWLAQRGQDRGGFYSFDLLENLVGCQMPAVTELRPELQRWTPGDRLWMYPREKANGTGHATLREMIPGRALCSASPGLGASAPEDGT